jgi:glycolate oxidase iron-sulfur subunit
VLVKTEFSSEFLATEQGAEANRILRACVHCGFCNATCPTYQVEGNELDGPRGRIYLIKSMLEGDVATDITRTHLDRCLTCRACETTCPSGVDYHQLLDIGRQEIIRRAPRPWWQRLWRRLLVVFMSRRRLFTPALQLGRWFRFLLPASFKHYVPPSRKPIAVMPGAGERQVILVQGCVQPGLSPDTNRSVASVLGRFGVAVQTVAAEQCCGAMAYHMDEQSRGLAQARANIDAWWPHIEQGAEAIVLSATGCSVFVKDYAHLLRNDPDYAERASRIVGLIRDVSEILAGKDLESLALQNTSSISWHCPCTAQHGQSLDETTQSVLRRLGFTVPAVTDSHLCCGSAGTYSLTQPRLATELRKRKLENLLASNPATVVTANIGCQVHLSGGTTVPVVHWIELLARELEQRDTDTPA